MKYLGYAVFAFGVVDAVGSWVGFDLWGSTGIVLPEMLWNISAYAEIALGYALLRFGSHDEEEVESSAAEEDVTSHHDRGDPGDDGE